MHDTDKQYITSIGLLSDFNSRAGMLVVQASALNGAVYSSAIDHAATVLIDEYKSLSPVAHMFPTLDPAIHSQVTVIARDANLAISSLAMNEAVLGLASVVVSKPSAWLNSVDSFRPPGQFDSFAQVVGQSVHTVSSVAALNLASGVAISSHIMDPYKSSILGIESNFAKLTATSVLAESALSSFKWSNLGNQIGIYESARATISDSFVAVSESYSDVFRSIQTVPQTLIDFNRSVFRRTPVEYYTGAELCRAITVPYGPVVEEELITNEILSDNKSGLESLLPRIDPGLVDMWHGANDALASKNPDRIRHFSSSVRELLTHVIHRLSPDEEVAKWTSDPHHFHGGRPTREARLLYISRNIMLDAFQKFVHKDVTATVEFLNIFHEGTHSVKSSFTERQLLALKTRAESTLNFLIEIGLQDT